MYVGGYTNYYSRQKIKIIATCKYIVHLQHTTSGNIIADLDRAQRALSESGRNFEKGRKMTEKKILKFPMTVHRTRA